MQARIATTPRLGTLSLNGLKTLTGLISLLVLVGTIYLLQMGQATMTGQRAQELLAQAERLNRENAQLEYDIATLAAPARIAERARAMGLRPATPAQTKFVVVNNFPVAQPKPTAPEIVAVAPRSGLDAWWNDLLAWLGVMPSANQFQAKSSP